MVCKKITVKPETRLERNVKAWINERASEYDNGAEGALKDLFYGGCISGMVGHLVYYADTVKFFAKYRRDISALLKEAIFDCGKDPESVFGDKWEKYDPLAQEMLNRNLLAWFGFEEAARRLADRQGIEV